MLTQGELGDFSRSVFVIDALICTVAIAGARFAERAIVRGIELARSGEGRRVLIVGAGRTGRSMLRELRETPGERVVGFVDDDPRLRGRRLNGVRVAGSDDEPRRGARSDATRHRLRDDPECAEGAPRRDRPGLRVREIDCRFVRREIDVDPRVILGGDTLTQPKPTLLDRLLAAYPLLVAYLVLLMLYAWQTTRIPSPWIFTDELKWALLSRSIAHTGRPEIRENAAPVSSLYSYFLAPAWWAGATAPGYAAAKYLNAVVMTATIFPAYGLARLFLTRRPACSSRSRRPRSRRSR